MNTTKWIAAAVLTLSIAGFANAQEGLNAQDKMFLMKAHQGDIAEIKTSQLALKKTRNEKVRMVAQMLIKGHTMSLNDRKTIAMKHNFTLPMDTDSMHKAMLTKLTKMSGGRFDKMYMALQVKDHNATIALFTKELADGGDTHVREHAQKFLPDIQNHTAMIHNVASNLGIQVSMPKMASKMDKMKM